MLGKTQWRDDFVQGLDIRSLHKGESYMTSVCTKINIKYQLKYHLLIVIHEYSNFITKNSHYFTACGWLQRNSNYKKHISSLPFLFPPYIFKEICFCSISLVLSHPFIMTVWNCSCPSFPDNTTPDIPLTVCSSSSPLAGLGPVRRWSYLAG